MGILESSGIRVKCGVTDSFGGGKAQVIFSRILFAIGSSCANGFATAGKKLPAAEDRHAADHAGSIVKPRKRPRGERQECPASRTRLVTFALECLETLRVEQEITEKTEAWWAVAEEKLRAKKLNRLPQNAAASSTNSSSPHELTRLVS